MPIKRCDYKPPVYKINKVELNFDIKAPGKGDTIVKGTMHYQLNNGDPGAPLVLNAKESKLISVKINGELVPVTVTKDGDFELVTISTMSDAPIPTEGVLEIENKLEPWDDDSCEGLYNSQGILVTQCEATEFRKIMPFVDTPDNLAVYTTTITADEELLPVLLSNGNLLESAKLADGRHFVKYNDPFPKPSYLFALVAGKLSTIADSHLTASGRKINLFVRVEAGHISKATLAMKAIKAGLAWQEKTLGLEYRLNFLNLVGVGDGNMGGMENTSLLVFNDECLLADPLSTDDDAMMGVVDVVVHELFHDRAGNDVTVNQFIELALKEGLATYLESVFMTDTFGYDRYRMDEIKGMRGAQFSEDAGPTAHAVRPDEIDSIHDVYSHTIYLKGAELLHMLEKLLGRETFFRGLRRYFDQYSGQAVTIEHFLRAQQEQADKEGHDFDLTNQFLRWYSFPGTPKLEISEEYAAEDCTYTLHITQSNPGKDGVERPPMLMPIRVNLLDSAGNEMWPTTKTLVLSESSQSFVFYDINEHPVPSLLRDFTAPVIITKSPIDPKKQKFLFKMDPNVISRWMNGQDIFVDTLMQICEQIKSRQPLSVDPAVLDAFKHILQDKKLSDSSKAEMLRVPGVRAVVARLEIVDIDALVTAREFLMETLATEYNALLLGLYEQSQCYNDDTLTQESVGKRSLHNLCLTYLSSSVLFNGDDLVDKQCTEAVHMTELSVAFELAISGDRSDSERQEIAGKFYERWKHDHLAVSQWLISQACCTTDDTIENLTRLLQHPGFDMTAPNHVRDVFEYFGIRNSKHFHRADGAGYKFVADAIIAIDPKNSGLAADLPHLFKDWRKFDPKRQEMMIAELRRIAAVESLSEVCRAPINKILAKAPGGVPAAPVREATPGALLVVQFEGSIREVTEVSAKMPRLSGDAMDVEMDEIHESSPLLRG